MKIYIVENFCGCRLCRGSQKIESELDREAHRAFESGEYSSHITGGRNPSMIVFPTWGTVGVMFSANGNAWREVPAGTQEVLRVADSVHGCHKMRCNQEFAVFDVLHRDCEIIETRKSRQSTLSPRSSRAD